MYTEKPQQSHKACINLFRKIFPDVEFILKEFAPEGWKNSVYFFVFHPTPEQQYEEALQMHENMSSMFGKEKKSSKHRPPKFSDFIKKRDVDKIQPEKETVELTGYCLWDIFSNNHEVISEDGKVYDIGSFRGAAGFIAEFINMHRPAEDERYDYIDFYMGTIWIRERADLIPVYDWIFSNLKSLNCDWIYSFPRMNIISPDEIKEGMGLDEMKPEDYDHQKAFLEEAERGKRKEETRKMREKFDKIYDEEVENAKDKPLPKVVQAYKNVYKTLPDGWPHK